MNSDAAALWACGRRVVVDLDPGLLEQLARALEARPRHADRHPGHQWAGVVERLHYARKALLGLDVGAAEQVLLGDAAVLEAEVGRVGRADPELVLEPVELQAGVVALDHERLDRGTSLLGIERRPHHDQVGAVTGGDEDLLAVEDILVAVESGGRADRGGVRSRVGLGDRHRGPLAAEALELLLVGDGGDRRLAQALARHRQQQPDVAPAQLGQAKQAGHVAAVAVGVGVGLLGARAVAVAIAAHAARARAAQRAALVHAVDRGREHVELLGVGVLGAVVLARVGPEDLCRHHVGLADEGGELAGCLEIDGHQWCLR